MPQQEPQDCVSIKESAFCTAKDLQSAHHAPFYGSDGRVQETLEETNGTRRDRGDVNLKVFISH